MNLTHRGHSRGPHRGSARGTPRDVPPRKMCKTDGSSGELQSIPMYILLKRNMTISELIEMDLVDKFISDQSGSRYLQRLMSMSRDPSHVKDQKRRLEVNTVQQNVSQMIAYCVAKHKQKGSFDLTAISEHVYGNC